MKRFMKGLALAVTLVLCFMGVFGFCSVSVLAAGGIAVSPASLTIEVGESKTFTITATNVIGDVAIASSNANVARAGMSEWGTGMIDEGQTKTGNVTVTGVSEGNATITLVLDAATFDGEDLAGQSRAVTVNVVAKPKVEENVSSPVSSDAGSETVDSGSSSGGGSSYVASGESVGGNRSDDDEVSAIEDSEGGENDEDKKVDKSKAVEKKTSGKSGDVAGEEDGMQGESKGGLSFGVVLAGIGVIVVIAAVAAGVVYFLKKR